MRCFFCGKDFEPTDKVETVMAVGTYVIAHPACALAEKTPHVMRSTIQSTKENIMAENTDPKTVITEASNETEVQPTRLQVLVTKHPRAAKVVAITGAVFAVGGIAQFTRTVQANRKHLEIAGDHAKAAVVELSTSVTPQSTDV